MKKKILKLVDRSGVRGMSAERQVQVALAVAALLVSAIVMGQRQANIMAAASGLAFNPELLCQMPGETAASLKKDLTAKQAALASAKKKLAANPYQQNADAQDKILAYTEKNLNPIYKKIEAAHTESLALENAHSSTTKTCPSKRMPGGKYPTTTWCRVPKDYVYSTAWGTSTEAVAAKKKYESLSATVAKLQKQAAPFEAQVQKMEAARQKIVYANGSWEEYLELHEVVLALPAEIEAISQRIKSFPMMKPCPTTEALCENKIDEDVDGATDCADTDCAANVACKGSGAGGTGGTVGNGNGNGNGNGGGNGNGNGNGGDGNSGGNGSGGDDASCEEKYGVPDENVDLNAHVQALKGIDCNDPICVDHQECDDRKALAELCVGDAEKLSANLASVSVPVDNLERLITDLANGNDGIDDEHIQAELQSLCPLYEQAQDTFIEKVGKALNHYNQRCPNSPLGYDLNPNPTRINLMPCKGVTW